jgi:hypothetical protein
MNINNNNNIENLTGAKTNISLAAELERQHEANRDNVMIAEDENYLLYLKRI